MKTSLLALACIALSACTVSHIDIAKAEHACASKGAQIDYISALPPASPVVKCTNGERVNIGSYNPHANNPQEGLQKALGKS